MEHAALHVFVRVDHAAPDNLAGGGPASQPAAGSSSVALEVCAEGRFHHALLERNVPTIGHGHEDRGERERSWSTAGQAGADGDEDKPKYIGLREKRNNPLVTSCSGWAKVCSVVRARANCTRAATAKVSPSSTNATAARRSSPGTIRGISKRECVTTMRAKTSSSSTGGRSFAWQSPWSLSFGAKCIADPFVFGRLHMPNPQPPRKQPQQARSRHLVAAVIEAAARVFDEYGYEGATMTGVAEIAGVGVGSMYQYFPDKRSLVTFTSRTARGSYPTDHRRGAHPSR